MNAHYSIAAGGNGIPLEPRRYSERESELSRRCMQWLDALGSAEGRIIFRENDEKFNHAYDIIGTLEIGIDDAHALIADPRVRSHSEGESAGLFVSAAYNRCRQDIITIDFDSDVRSIGYRCEKILVNNGSVGAGFGDNAGIVVNRSIIDEAFFVDSLAINLGEIRGNCGVGVFGLLINAGKVRGVMIGAEGPEEKALAFHLARDWGSSFRSYRRIAEFSPYLASIVDTARNDPAGLKRYGTPREIRDHVISSLEAGE